MPDQDGYPTDEELLKIRNFRGSVHDFIELIRSLWWHAGSGVRLKGKKILQLQLHTWGWSGNESIIGELKSTFFWFFFWEKSVRGGHYWFRIPLKQVGDFKDWGGIKK